MREIFYNSDVTPKAENELKLLALYYEKVNIINDAVYTIKLNELTRKPEPEKLSFIPQSFSKDYKLLLDEKIISVISRDENVEDEYAAKFSKKISAVVNSNNDLIYPNHPTEKDGKIITEEVYDIMHTLLGFEFGKPVEEHFMWFYYAFKLKWLLKFLIEGKTCIGSNNLNQLFLAFIGTIQQENEEFKANSLTKSIAVDAIRLSLPNPESLSFEDILELKYKLKDELGLFYQTINDIEIRNKQLFDINLKPSEYDNIFYREIEKPLNELKISMQNLKSRTLRNFIKEMQNPKTYIPLAGSFIPNVPIQYCILLSLGMATGLSYFEYKEQFRELTNNGLYFLLKLHK